jgi:hypothetical protein
MDEDLSRMGDDSFIMWNTDNAHMVIFGSTGSGKTYYSKSLLGRISLYAQDSELYVCDFKGDSDFDFLADCERFYRYDSCIDGLTAFYERFKVRQGGNEGKSRRNMITLYFDEWASYLNAIDDKKVQEAEKRKMSNLLMLGRSFNFHVIVSQQRVDAQYFSTARDNFSIVIGLGNLSAESRDMFYSAYKKDIKPDRRRGTGYMLTNGNQLTRVIVPTIRDFGKLHNAIKDAVTRQTYFK